MISTRQRIPENNSRRDRLHAPVLRWRKLFARSVRWAARCFPVIAVLAAVAPQASDASPAMHEVAEPAVRPAGAPEYADVAFRYAWVRTSSFPTVQDAKDAIRDFHATRVDWFYPGSHAPAPGPRTYVTPESQDFIDWCHANGMKIGGAINTTTSHQEWGLKDANHNRYVGDPNNQDYIDAAVAWGKAQIDAGLDSLVCDDFFRYDSSEKQLFSDRVISVIKAYQPGFEIAANKGDSLGTDYVVPYAFDFHYADTPPSRRTRARCGTAPRPNAPRTRPHCSTPTA